MPFLDTNSHLTTKPYNFDSKCQCNSESYDQHGYFGTKVRGGQSFWFTMGGFFDKREYSGADWLDRLLTNKVYLLFSKKNTLLSLLGHTSRSSICLLVINNKIFIKRQGKKYMCKKNTFKYYEYSSKKRIFNLLLAIFVVLLGNALVQQ